MKKKSFGRFTAIGLAAITAVPAFSMVASADYKEVSSTDKQIYGTVYKLTITKEDYQQNGGNYFGSTPASINDASLGALSDVPINDINIVSSTYSNSIKAIFEKDHKDQYGKITSDEFKTNGAFDKNKAIARGWVLKNGATDEDVATSYIERSRYTYSVTSVNAVSAFGKGKDVFLDLVSGAFVTASTNGYGTNCKISGTASNNPNDSYTYGYYYLPSYFYASTYVYKASDGYFYPNKNYVTAAGLTVVSSYANGINYNYSASRPYFCFVDGNYYVSTYASPYPSDTYYMSAADSTVYTTPLFRSSVTSRYYLSYSQALAASNYVSAYVSSSSTTTTGTYFNRYTGKFYSDYSSAVAASSSADVVSESSINYTSYAGDTTVTGGTASYLDPYYYYLMGYGMPGATGTNTSKSTTAASSSEAATVVNGKYVYGMAGITTAINAASSGSTISVSMNENTSLTKSVISAAKAKKVTLKLTMSNGVVFVINGSDVSSAKTINLDTTYNTKNIPTSLISKATKGAKSKAQINIGDNKTLGLNAAVTVKFSTSRSGLTAKLYRYDTANNVLKLVDSAKVTSTGAVTFNEINAGGDFLIVLS